MLPQSSAMKQPSPHQLSKPTSKNTTPVKPTTISIDAVKPTTLPPYRRLVKLLLPVRYKDDFFKTALDPTSSIARCAIYHEAPLSAKATAGQQVRPLNSPTQSTSNGAAKEAEPHVVAGIQCRFEPIPSPSSPMAGKQQLYIQTLATLAPYRDLGIATALLESTIATAIDNNIDVVSIYAHVWEANEEALEWYVKRGFMVEEEMIERYYSKLRPAGARVVRRRIGVGEYLRGSEGVRARGMRR